MLTKVLKNNQQASIVLSIIWVVVSALLIWWLIHKNNQTPVVPGIDQRSNLLEGQKILQAAEFLDEDQLTTNAPSATLKTEPASPEAEIEQTPE